MLTFLLNFPKTRFRFKLLRFRLVITCERATGDTYSVLWCARVLKKQLQIICPQFFTAPLHCMFAIIQRVSYDVDYEFKSFQFQLPAIDINKIGQITQKCLYRRKSHQEICHFDSCFSLFYWQYTAMLQCVLMCLIQPTLHISTVGN